MSCRGGEFEGMVLSGVRGEINAVGGGDSVMGCRTCKGCGGGKRMVSWESGGQREGLGRRVGRLRGCKWW